MDQNMRNYLRCLNYTDSCWGNFLSRFDTDSTLANTVVCFMGDHTILDPMMRAEFQEYCEAKGLDFKPSEAYTAIVAYSPDLTEQHTISEETYQMDAYPTILYLIGAENYYWRGFGANLLDSTACHHRTLSEEDAYILSDKMIRSDYFRTTLGKE
jgi:phosphoglycerol transferase MdoB-like AlkP superfamily enzyme